MTIQNNLYNGDVEVTFESFRHQYKEGGRVVPSVTTILSVINKPQLISWAANMAVETISSQITPGIAYDEMQLMTIMESGRIAHQKKKTDAAALGTFVHDWVEKYIKGEPSPMPVNPILRDSIEKFLLWVEKYNVKFLKSEQIIFSKKYRYTGKLDFICSINDELYLGDLKTSKGIYNEMWVQTAAYRQAREEEFPQEKYAGQLIIRIDKNMGDFEFAVCRDEVAYRSMFVGFIAALKLHNTLEELKTFKGEKE
jgi:hypothetical protein